MYDIVWDMETNDPDDFLTLLFLLGHPLVNLKAVTIYPGSAAQVGLVIRAVSKWMKHDIPIGARNLDHPKASISQWHYDAYGDVAPSREARPAAEVLHENCDENTTLITGAALTNLAAAIKLGDFRLGRLVAQGGFAGEGVVPPELQLEKFKGLRTCPTHNLMSDKKAANTVLTSSEITAKYFVSKNVCHRVVYDQTMHERFETVKDESLSLTLIHMGMECYLQQNPAGKLLHDPLAACCAIDTSIAQWAEVELFREGNEWGSRLQPDSGTWIIVDYDHKKFVQTLTAY